MECSPTGVCGLIPAGGNSRRFGVDKTRYLIDDVPMVSRVFDVVRAVCQPVALGLASDRVPSPLPGVPLVFDDPAESGPLGSICAGLGNASAPWMLVVAADQPYVTVFDLRQLLTARTAGVMAVVACDASGRRHPLCACYHRSALPPARAEIQAGRYALHGLIDRLAYRTVLLSGRALRNVNRREDLDRRHRNYAEPL